MDLQNLKEHCRELVSFMEKNGYSEHYVKLFREEIRHILSHAEGNSWKSYRDIYLDYLKSPHSENYLRNKRTVIGALSSSIFLAISRTGDAATHFLKGAPTTFLNRNSRN